MSGRYSVRWGFQRNSVTARLAWGALAWGALALAGCDSKGGGQGDLPDSPRPEGNSRPGRPTPPAGPNGNGTGGGTPVPGTTPLPGTGTPGAPGGPGIPGAPGTPGTTNPTPGPTAAPTEPPPPVVPALPEPAPRAEGEPPAVRPEPSLVSRFVFTCDAALLKDRIARITNRQPGYTADERTVSALRAAADTFDCRVAAERIQRQEWIDVSGKGLTSAEFLGMAVGAKTLLLRDNRLADIAALAPLAGLRSLSLSKNPVTTLRPLAGLRWLEALAISETSLPRGSLASLSQLGRLGRLALKGTHLSRSDAGVIGSLAGLEDLDLRGARFDTPSDTALLRGLTSLRKLDLAKSNVSTLAFAAPFERLEELDASGTRLAWLPGGARWRSLQTLVVADTGVADVAGFVQTSRLPGLKTLILKGTKVTKLRELSKVGTLLYLNYEDTPAARGERCPYDNWDVCER